MGYVLFENDENAYLNWKKINTTGYIISTRNDSDFIIHESRCPSLKGSQHYTDKQFKKICADGFLDLSQYIDSNKIRFNNIALCKRCLPNCKSVYDIQKRVTLEKKQQETEKNIDHAYTMSDEKLSELLEKTQRNTTSQTTVTVYNRNPYVAARVLKNANGICQKCNQYAPFHKASNGAPYLEIHHVIPLSEGGPDEVDNCLALCPNCHRKLHFG